MTEALKFALKENEQFTYHEHDNGLKYYRHDYFDKHDDLENCPQSYLIKQLPLVTNPLHFHTQNQFQVFIEGTGSFGRHAVNPYVVHYAGAFTGYGPIIAGPQGLQYLTLRASRDLGAQFLPEKMENLKKGPKHHYTSPSIRTKDLSELSSLSQSTLSWIHQENTLGVGVLEMPAENQYQLSIPQNIAGVFLIAMQGTVYIEDTKLVKNENIFAYPKLQNIQIETLGLPTQILVLQMPLRDAGYPT